ncbi:unnamed protein product [Caenorhabditis angaria]|uniref:Signal recognition particle 19 kDa protein n=1 Tax=Caenorhabditis angaria TaxID=860376 RepID=A0A9P1I8H6_9PELO|nr:unnamed protein product [Caenorhabditis angaria]
MKKTGKSVRRGCRKCVRGAAKRGVVNELEMATTINLIKSEPLSSQKRWVVVYPAYIDKKLSTKQGRRISKLLAVENPTSVEIHDVLAANGMNPLLERNKMYPRCGDREPETQGRVRVQIKNDDGSAKNAQFSSRDSIYKSIAEMIPKLKTRQPGYVAPSNSGNPSGSGAAAKKNKKKK